MLRNCPTELAPGAVLGFSGSGHRRWFNPPISVLRDARAAENVVHANKAHVDILSDAISLKSRAARRGRVRAWALMVKIGSAMRFLA
jgi:hypothetical protein